MRFKRAPATITLCNAATAGLLIHLRNRSQTPPMPASCEEFSARFLYPVQFSRLHADMQEESRHDRAALQQLASSLAAPASIPLLK